MNRTRLTQLLAVVVLIGCLVGSGTVATALAGSVGRHRLAYSDRASEADPPQVALGIAMGAFRGIFVNFLWIRANHLKEEGKHYEAINLAKAITSLQPRFPRVWAFHAWNMSYNISVATDTPLERWEWVNKGIRLLRDEGLEANPNDLLLHKELSWIFLHKIGGFADDANQYYKRQLAAEWTYVLGEPPMPDVDFANREAMIDRYIEWLTAVDEAAGSMTELRERNPAAADLADTLLQDLGEPLGFATTRRYAIHQALARSGQRDLAVGGMGPRSARFEELFADPALADAWPDLISHLRQRLLVDVYHMEPRRMIEYTRKIGPLDWRAAGAHAVYWSARGVEVSQDRKGEMRRRDYDYINTDRITVQAIQDLRRFGEIYFDILDYAMGNSDFYLAAPNPHFIDSYYQIMEEARTRSWADQKGRLFSFYSAGYMNFMKDSIRFLYRRGQRDAAEKYMERAIEFLAEGGNFNNSDYAQFAQPLDEFIAQQFEGERFTSPNVAVEEMVGALQGAFTAGLLSGDNEVYESQMRYYAEYHRAFMQRQVTTTNIDPDKRRMEIVPEDPWLFAGLSFARFMSGVGLEYAERMYDNAPLLLQRYAYDAIVSQWGGSLAQLAEQGGRGLDEIFPEPPGMEAFRIERDRKLDEWRGPQLETQLN